MAIQSWQSPVNPSVLVDAIAPALAGRHCPASVEDFESDK